MEGLEYAFLFRDYQAGLGKWTTGDPLGYPDGWNNFAYCNNRTTSCFDWLGGEGISFSFIPGPYFVAQKPGGQNYVVGTVNPTQNSTANYEISSDFNLVITSWDGAATVTFKFGPEGDPNEFVGTSSRTNCVVVCTSNYYATVNGHRYEYKTYSISVTYVIKWGNYEYNNAVSP